MSLGDIGRAVFLFVVTNVDDVLVLALFFARGAGRRGATARIVVGQYLGFLGILVISVAGAYGATFLPDSAIRYLGVVPLALGLRSAWQAWRDRGHDDDDRALRDVGPSTWAVAAVTFANGGDNIGVYVPVFATGAVARTSLYVLVFLFLLAALLAAGRLLATRRAVAILLTRWGHVLLPIVLIALGLLILLERQTV